MWKTTRWRARAISLAVIAAGSALGAWTFAHLEVTAEITHFLPSSEDRELARIAAEMASSDLTRTVTLTIDGPSPEVAASASAALVERLARRPEVEWVRSGTSDDLEEAFYTLDRKSVV